MQNFDLMSILPLLSGGQKDMSSILAAMGKTQSPPPSAPPPQPSPSAPRYPDYTKLYPNSDGSQNSSAAAGSGASAKSSPDMATVMQLIAAMNAGKNDRQPPPPQQEIAPTATREIRASLATILSINELAPENRDKKTPKT